MRHEHDFKVGKLTYLFLNFRLMAVDAYSIGSETFRDFTKKASQFRLTPLRHLHRILNQ